MSADATSIPTPRATSSRPASTHRERRPAPAAALAASSPARSTPTPSSSDRAPARRDRLRLAARLSPLLGLAISITLVIWGLSTGVLESSAALQAFINSLGAWGPAVFLLVSTAAVVFPVVPGGLLVIAGPVLFGPLEGTLLNYIAVCAGSLLNFTIARHVGMDLIERVFTPRAVEKALGWTRSRHFTRGFALAIALPVAPDDLLCYLAGTTRMRWRTYVAIILLCKPWALIAYGLGVSAILLRVLPW
ncbi:MAG TPA: TVP38/TMEM64 family protein [Candidatus Brachybacterium merdigallinarum]|nr:TVP38/TMEM64 family protein [Candidatus Brachybacterium merdigallinarum]